MGAREQKFNHNIRKDMKTRVLAALFCVAFIVCCVTFESLGVSFWISLGAVGAIGWYIERHKEELNAELDEVFGKEDDLI